MATLDPCPVDKVETFLPSFKSQLQVFLRIKDTNLINKPEQLKMVKYQLQRKAIGDYLETLKNSKIFLKSNKRII